MALRSSLLRTPESVIAAPKSVSFTLAVSLHLRFNCIKYSSIGKTQHTLSAWCSFPSCGIELFKSSIFSCRRTCWYPSIPPATIAPDTMAVAASCAFGFESHEAMVEVCARGGDGVWLRDVLELDAGGARRSSE